MSDGMITTVESAPAASPASNEPADDTVDLQALAQEGADQSGDDETPEQAAPTDDTEEVEYSGKKYKVHKDLKSALMMQADYTRKTQEIAERDRTLKSEREAYEQQVAARQENLGEHARLMAIDNAIKSYENVDWAAWNSQDPIGHNDGWREFQSLKDARAETVNKLQRFDAERSQKTQRETAQRLEEGARELARDIPGWGADLARKLGDFAVSSGLYTREEANNLRSARDVKLLHKAWLGEQVAARGNKQAPSATPALEPLKTVGATGGSPTTRKSLADMEMDEYVAARKAGRKN